MLDNIEQPEQNNEQVIGQQEASVGQEGLDQDVVQTQEQQTSQKEHNFNELRAKADKVARERDEALKRLQELEQARLAQQPQQQPEPDYSLRDDDLVEGKHLSKYDKKIKELEKQVQSYQQQSSEIAVEAKIKAQYNDFDKVVNNETVAALRETYPEIAETINSSSNLYSKAVSAYTMIKNLGIYKEDIYTKEKQLVQQNNTKPRSVASVAPQQGDSPLSRANAFANGLTSDLKEQLRREMLEARKRR